jgi:DNA-binding MarR family transcriptional regulator
MSSDSASDRKQALIQELFAEVRGSQRATDIVDELACELLGVNATDARAMDLLDPGEQLTAGQLAEALGLTTGAITAVIDRLERRGYARRVQDPADRRRVLVESTPKARQAGWEIYGPLAEAAGPLSERYTDEELELLIEFMRSGRELNERLAATLRERLRTRTKS